MMICDSINKDRDDFSKPLWARVRLPACFLADRVQFLAQSTLPGLLVWDRFVSRWLRVSIVRDLQFFQLSLYWHHCIWVV
jgi:hypothetical protein